MIDASTTSISNAVLHINQLTDDDFKVENLILQELPQAHTRKIKQIISKHIDNHQLSTSENKIQQLLASNFNYQTFSTRGRRLEH